MHYMNWAVLWSVWTGIQFMWLVHDPTLCVKLNVFNI